MPVLVWDFGGTHMTNTMKSLIDLILMLVGLGTLTYVSLIHRSFGCKCCIRSQLIYKRKSEKGKAQNRNRNKKWHASWKTKRNSAPMQDRTTDLQFTRLTLYH